MDADKKSFYEKAAKGLAASTLMYGVDSIVHVEDKDDIWFWRQIISKYRPVKYKFMPATTNEKGQRNTGCTQCLKYRGYLSRKFFVCIDSDLRYMLDEDVSAENGILQTYTYSWENHCAFARRLQETFARRTGKGDSFDFELFLEEYSRILYEPFLFMLYNERNGLRGFNRDKFRSIITLQYRQGDELNNGEAFLSRLASSLSEVVAEINDRGDFNHQTEAARYSAKGLTRDNVYLYVRGHCLYNSLVSIGKKLCEGTGVDFEQNVQKDALAFEEYDAISRIKSDVGVLNTVRLNMPKE